MGQFLKRPYVRQFLKTTVNETIFEIAKYETIDK